MGTNAGHHTSGQRPRAPSWEGELREVLKKYPGAGPRLATL